MEKICCATCKNRGRGFENQDESGVQHCTLLSREEETKCHSRNYQEWQPDAPGNAQQQVQADPTDSLT
jgi:hypothetical protein